MSEMKRLTQEEKEQVLLKAKSLKWDGCMCTDCLEVIASIMLDKQLEINPLEIE